MVRVLALELGGAAFSLSLDLCRLVQRLEAEPIYRLISAL
jgi:hypothetical protein